jgi:hypothetical protein
MRVNVIMQPSNAAPVSAAVWTQEFQNEPVGFSLNIENETTASVSDAILSE